MAYRLRPRQVSDYGSLEDLRDDLIRSIGAYRREQSRSTVADYDPEVLSYLTNILKTDPDGEIRFEAAVAVKLLGQSGGVDNGPLIAALTGGLKDLQANVRTVCVLGLGTFKNGETVGILLEHLKTEADVDVCRNCIFAFGEFKNAQGLQAVVQAYALVKNRSVGAEFPQGSAKVGVPIAVRSTFDAATCMKTNFHWRPTLHLAA